MEFRIKVWAENNGQPLMGPGRFRLLNAVDELKSINAAAKEMNLSYRRAWSQIREMEQVLGCPLIVSNRGGASKESTQLTREAVRLLEQYRRIRETVGLAVRQKKELKDLI